MHFIHKYRLTLFGVVFGAIAGLAYYKFIGCSNGSCAITSHPLSSTLYGAAMGALLLSTFNKEQTEKSDKS